MFVDSLAPPTVKIDKATWQLWVETGRGTASHPWLWTEDAIRLAVENVNRGALLLDEKKPDWVSEIIPENLKMENAELCIIGQAYGTYDRVGVPFGIPVYGSDGYDSEREDELAFQHGFASGDSGNGDYVPYPVLDRVWVYLLHARHELQTPVILNPPDLN